MNPPLPAVDLTGKVALVTGGGRGLGRHMAQKLAEAGAAVAITGRTASSLDETVEAIRVAGGNAIAIAADVTERVAVERVVEEIENQLGAVDVLVNNAAIVDPLGPVAEVDPDAWWHLMEVNLRGPFLCARAVLPSMIQRKQGVIMNVASNGAYNTVANVTAYCASKAALVRFTDCLAAEVKEHNVATFSVHPGIVRTDMTEILIQSKYLPGVADFFAAGRDVPPELPANLIVFLASGQANRLSGRFIEATDNLLDMLQRADEILQNDLYMLRLRT